MGGYIQLDQSVTQEEFAEIVGASQPAISGWVASGFLPEGATLGEWLRIYCQRLRETAAGRAGELSEERARLARAQAENVEMKNAILRREYAPVALLEEAVARTARQMAGILEALPVKLKRAAPMLSADELELVEREIVALRNQAASARLDADGDWSGASGDDEPRPPPD